MHSILSRSEDAGKFILIENLHSMLYLLKALLLMYLFTYLNRDIVNLHNDKNCV
jgi:hypothetical protein